MTLVMKALLYVVTGLLVIISVYFIGLSVSSRKQPDLGIYKGQLRACPATPNCVSSERQGTGTYVEPLMVVTTANNTWNTSWKDAKQAVVEIDGEIMAEREGYLHARFVTPLMRYIDDVELRIDENKQVIQIRSASRVGRSDFGASRTRVEKIRMAFLRNSEQDKF